MAVNAFRQLNMNNSQVAKSLEKLASGYRVNRAGDDASGLAISEKMKAQIKGLETASSNAQDGISLIQTAEGALTEVHDMLNRMVELAGKSANGTMDDTIDRAALQAEVVQLKDEIDRIAEGTNFNGLKLLDGSLAGGGVGSTAGALNKIGSGLDGIFKFGQSAPVAAVAAEYTIVSGEEEAFLEALGIEDAEDTSASAILAALGLNGNDYEVLKGDGSGDAITADATADGVTIKAKNAGVDAGRDKILLAGLSGGVKGALYEAVAGADAYRDTVITVDPDITNDLALIGKTITINGKTYEFAGQAQKDENDLYLNTGTADTATTSGTLKPGGSKLENGNYAIYIGAATNTGASIANDVAEAVAKTISAVETGVGGTDPGTAAIITTNTQATIDALGGDYVGYTANKIRLYSTNLGSNAGAIGSGGLTLQVGDTNESFNQITVSVEDMSTKGLGIANLDISVLSGGQEAIDMLRGTLMKVGSTGSTADNKGAINLVSEARATMGALQNRLEHTINNLDVAVENMTAANSRIRDTDMAKEMMNYTKMTVLTQAAQAMLAQATQQPQSILQLLQ